MSRFCLTRYYGYIIAQINQILHAAKNLLYKSPKGTLDYLKCSYKQMRKEENLCFWLMVKDKFNCLKHIPESSKEPSSSESSSYKQKVFEIDILWGIFFYSRMTQLNCQEWPIVKLNGWCLKHFGICYYLLRREKKILLSKYLNSPQTM